MRTDGPGLPYEQWGFKGWLELFVWAQMTLVDDQKMTTKAHYTMCQGVVLHII